MILDGMQGSPNCPEGTTTVGVQAWLVLGQHGGSSMERVGTEAL